MNDISPDIGHECLIGERGPAMHPPRRGKPATGDTRSSRLLRSAQAFLGHAPRDPKGGANRHGAGFELFFAEQSTFTVR